MVIDRVNCPSDLKQLNIEDLSTLADELRGLIIKTVSSNGGHLSSNLGIVELTIALHYVFDTSSDRIVWDVGHQSYAHKVLTGRKDRFSTIRQENGISGFPKISESIHDAFGTGHSSTSISSALGILAARDLRKENYKVIAVIGDGALSGGLAFEGLNNAGHIKKDLIVVLNDNEMSISKNVGALSSYMNRILTDERYRKFKKETKSFLEGFPRFGAPVAKIAQKAEEAIKGMILPGMLFEELGFDYIGPIDGHNIELLIDTLNRIKTSASPTLVHIITQKGKGYQFSEKDPCIFHGVGPFEVETGSQVSSKSLSFSSAFGTCLLELSEKDSRIVAITAAMKEGTGLDVFAEKLPERFFDVGIAEQHAVTFAAGLAAKGLRPVVAVYSTFLQRAYDQIVHDVCLQNLPVIFAIDRSGFVGEDGPTHHGAFDISFLRHIPGIKLLAPKNTEELCLMLKWAIDQKGPIAIRYPRGKAPEVQAPCAPILDAESEILRHGKDIALIAAGTTSLYALNAADRLKEKGITSTVINARFIKPLDIDTISEIALSVPIIMTIEENALQGGFGSAIIEGLNDTAIRNITIKRIGIPDMFIEQGPIARLRSKYGLDEDGIIKAAVSLLNR